MSTEKQPEWEKEFDEKFPADHETLGNLPFQTSGEIKSFIRTFASSLLDEVSLQRFEYGNFFFDPPRAKDGHILSESEKAALSSASKAWNDAADEIEKQVEAIKTRHGL